MTFSSLRWIRGTLGRAPFSATALTVTPIDVKVRTGATPLRGDYRPSHAQSHHLPRRRHRRAGAARDGRRGHAATAWSEPPVHTEHGASIPRGAGTWNLRKSLRQLAGDGARAEVGRLLRLRAELRLLRRV